ncbi:hypothetical protein DV515_00011644 [Chloebia gouldiae]|uniref:Uncharacterized protein n=1 Tax=Chloebia gouldiae TaxID=44316 RepID=A0A3L8S6C8_CHLGU|nr:hypothetical protein DV515_00011644 [Chloebia gouldiae]
MEEWRKWFQQRRKDVEIQHYDFDLVFFCWCYPTISQTRNEVTEGKGEEISAGREDVVNGGFFHFFT